MVSGKLTDSSEPGITKSDLAFNLSATSGAGFDLLLARLADYAGNYLAGAESALVTRARHRHALEETLAALRRARTVGLAGREDLLAEELRIAAQALGRLTGRVDVEDILDVIFRDFCIGK
jgi:tRNA modification GTPase